MNAALSAQLVVVRAKLRGIYIYLLCLPAILLMLSLTVTAVAQDQNEAPKTPPAGFMDILINRARALAASEFQPPASDLPQPLKDVTYEQYRLINFRAEQALWRDQSLFEVQFFHPGFLYQQPVTVQVIEPDGSSNRVQFDPANFDYRNEAAPLAASAQPGLGYAGFRVHFPINAADRKDEILVFQGASYFRLVAHGQVYGLSARGVAIDTAEPSGEQFPAFREFWLVRPQPEDVSLVIFALLDSPSLTGAYRFEVTPAAAADMQVEAHFFARQDINKLGVAPLTSMHFHGENHPRLVDDFRPEIHDSDGLSMLTADGRWMWRPLKNPRDLRITSLLAENPRGFGLLQRDRDFNNYLDPEARYSERPSLWVDMEGDWGRGRVELVEIPTSSETNDNIASYWVGEQPFRAGESRTYRYRLQSFGARLPEHQQAHVVRTRSGQVGLPGSDAPKGQRQFVVDFAGGRLATMNNALPLKAHVETNSGEVADVNLIQLPGDQGWRVAFKTIPKGTEPMDMRLHIALGEQLLSEVWSYVWYPDDPK